MVRLIMRRGQTPGIVYDLDGDEITIGRGNKNGIVIRDNEVSRDHCRLVRMMGTYEVHDLGSSNGTFVNGQRVSTPWLLQPGSMIEFGDSITLEFNTENEEIPAIENGTLVRLEPTAHYSLMMIRGPSTGDVYPLESKLITIGRDLANDIVIQDPEVSRYHVRLHFTRSGYLLEDLSSTNGTFINGEPLSKNCCLNPNDVIKLGTMVQLQYILREETPDGDDDTPISGSDEHDLEDDEAFKYFFQVEASRRAISARSTGLEPGALRDHLMIVYAREDWETVVAPLLVRLQDTRLNAWVDQYLALDSDNWRTAVEQALKECWLMVLAVSPHTHDSIHVRMMYRYFLNENKPVIALLSDSTQALPGELNRLRSIAYDPENNARSFHKLIFEIMQHHQQQI